MSERRNDNGFPAGGGETGALIRAFDWSNTTLGPLDAWPPHLKSTVNLMLASGAQIVLFWGTDFLALYNDAYAPTIGAKHPKALGRPARDSWSELWDDLEPLLRGVVETGETFTAKDRPFYIERHGYPENVYFDVSYSPVRNDSGGVDGVLCIVSETTQRIIAQQKLTETQEQQHLLLRETNHRLKNLFANINALITLSVRSARTPEEFADALRGRLSALLQAKELVHPGTIGAEHPVTSTTVDVLVKTILQPYHDETSLNRIIVSGPELPVGRDAVTSLALALHESATNAVKYGALSIPNGTITAMWQKRGNDFDLVWTESGGPKVVAPTARGFGSFLAERSVRQLGGKIEYDWQANGLTFRLTVPLDRLGA